MASTPEGAVAAATLADAAPAARTLRVGAAAVLRTLHAAVARRARACALQAGTPPRAQRRGAARRAAAVKLAAGTVPAAVADAHRVRCGTEAHTAPQAAARARRRTFRFLR